MKKYVSYLRVSTARQGESGLGLEAQRETIQRFLEREGGSLASEFIEVESGRLRNRPGLLQSIAQCQRERATLIVARLDRLARNVAFVAALMEAGVEFIAVDVPHANRLMIHVLSAFAEYEREQVSIRTKVALQAARARGVKLGTNGAVLAAKRQLAAVEFAYGLASHVDDLKRHGAMTLTGLADGLNGKALATREGKPWTAATVHRLLKRLDGNLQEGGGVAQPLVSAEPLSF